MAVSRRARALNGMAEREDGPLRRRSAGHVPYDAMQLGYIPHSRTRHLPLAAFRDWGSSNSPSYQTGPALVRYAHGSAADLAVARDPNLLDRAPVVGLMWFEEYSGLVPQ